MSFPHPFNLNESRPEVRLETFEDLTTARRAVGEVRGFEDPITSELLADTQHAFGRGYNEFQPKTYTGPEAGLILDSLKKVAKARNDELAISANDALSRMPPLPLRLRAGMFMSGLLSKREPTATDAPRSVSGPLFDPTFEGTRPPIVWESKFDNSRKGKRSSS